MDLKALQKAMGYQFQNERLLEQALTHKSCAFEKRPFLPHNERLELLGDAVLGLITTDMLIHNYPEHQEGELSKARAAMVSEVPLSKLALELGLDEYMRLGKGEIVSGGSQKPRILACTFEAVVGAVYLDGGLEGAQNFIKNRLGKLLDGVVNPGQMILDYKTKLQELVQEKFKSLPKYLVIREEGPPHQKFFEVQVFVDSQMMGFGEGKSKKEAEQAAAREAIGRIQGVI